MSIFPAFVQPENKTEQIELPMLKEYAYDFDTNELKLRDGKNYLVEGNEALKIWIFKAIVTARYKYIAYSEQFGTEIFEVIGTTLSSEAKKAEVRRYIIETLMVNPYILSIERIELSQIKDNLDIEVFVKSIYEDKVVNVHCLIEIA
ncbi:MAG: DUF2634 domain-containing protein [Peptostreptococcaceae bacterium]|nr:DUF2634 domain-containing protein [Peptostreptococcaceae bacterium]